jgi:glucose-1-phosphate cytidylyltransferase
MQNPVGYQQTPQLLKQARFGTWDGTLKKKITALILCGGKGERLRPLTDMLPKPLVLLRGRPILSYVITHLQKYGINDIVIAAGYQKEKIYDFFSQNYHDLNVEIVDSGDVDIIERIKSCSSLIKDDFILLYGDTLANVNLEHLQKFHFSHNSKATITLWPFKSPFGLFDLDQDGNAIDYREKPTLKQLINIGYFYYDTEIFSWIKDFSAYTEFMEFMVNKRKLKGYIHHGVHLTVNTIRELEDAEKVVDEFEEIGVGV